VKMRQCDRHLLVGAFTVFLLVLSLTTIAEAGMVTSILNKAYSILGYETCEPPNLHDGAVKRKY